MTPVMGAAEIGAMLGVKRQRVQQIVNGPGFPAPYANLAMGKVWLTADVRRWAVDAGRIEPDGQDTA